MIKKIPHLSTFNAIFFILLLGTLIYSNSFQASFHWDDYPAIVKNQGVRDIADLNRVFEAFNTRFLSGLTFTLNYHFHQLDVFGYHLVNLLIHLSTSCLVYSFMLLLLKTPQLKDSLLKEHEKLLAFFAALLFLTHPIQTQSVTYIWQRVTSLGTFFYLLAVVLYFQARLTSRLSYYLGALVATVFGMFVKENTITIPFMLALSEFSLFGTWKEDIKRRPLLLMPFIICLGIIPFVLLMQAKSMGVPSLRSEMVYKHTQEQYWLTQPNVFVTYLRLLVFPIHLRFIYDYPLVESLLEWRFLFSLLIIGSFFALTFFFYEKKRFLFFLMSWYLIGLSLESVKLLGEVIHERRLYLSMVSAAIFVPSVLYLLLRDIKKCTFILVVIVSIFSVATYRRNWVYQNEFTLVEDNMKHSPNRGPLYKMLMDAYGRRGDIDRMVKYALKYMEIEKHRGSPYLSVGFAFAEKGELDKAESFFLKAIAVEPKHEEGYLNLATIYGMKGNYEKAIEFSKYAIDINPYDEKSYNNLGIAYSRIGKLDEAIEAFKRAVDISSDYAEGYNSLGVAYGKKGEYQQAVFYFEKALSINPDHQDAKKNLKVTYQKQGVSVAHEGIHE